MVEKHEALGFSMMESLVISKLGHELGWFTYFLLIEDWCWIITGGKPTASSVMVFFLTGAKCSRQTVVQMRQL